MADKEKIIIDTVDVSECEYVCNTAFGNIGCKLPFNEEIHCCNIPNCYYKQLARKMQECEQKDEVIEELMRERQELQKQLRRQIDMNVAIQKECEELKKELNGSEKWRVKSESLNEKLDIENTRYCKALGMIKDIVATSLSDDHDPAEGLHGEIVQILDIINEAKEGKNDR